MRSSVDTVPSALVSAGSLEAELALALDVLLAVLVLDVSVAFATS
jgi:hypothetical protein